MIFHNNGTEKRKLQVGNEIKAHHLPWHWPGALNSGVRRNPQNFINFQFIDNFFLFWQPRRSCQWGYAVDWGWKLQCSGHDGDKNERNWNIGKMDTKTEKVKPLRKKFFLWIIHFRVPKAITFKPRPRPKPFLWKWVLFSWATFFKIP